MKTNFYQNLPILLFLLIGLLACNAPIDKESETEDTTSYFSFYDVAEKIGIIIGMFLFGAIDQITGSMRNSIVFFTLFFLLGGLLLLRVNRKPALD